MAEVAWDSDNDVEVTALSSPPRKRRPILEPSAIKAVAIYSRKLNEKDICLWPPSPPKSKNQPITISLIDSEEEPEPIKPRTRNQKLDELERHEDIPDFSDWSSQINHCCDGEDENDILIVCSEYKQNKRSAKPKPRERAQKISLKCRWRKNMHNIPVLSTDPLSKAVARLSVKLKVPSSKILLMRNDDELHVHSTITQLNLGTADIIDCIVISDDEDESNHDVITVRLQGQEKGSIRQYSLHMDAPLGSIFSQYTSGLSAAAKRKVKFFFDGLKVKHTQTPSQLDMEDGDIIEVWA